MLVHWVTPYDNPRNQSSTDYFVDENSVGKGDSGLDAALKTIRSRKPSAVVWIGSRYYYGRGWSPNEIPFRDRLGEINAVHDGEGIRRIDLQPHEFAVFSSFVP
jgi:hypothetical protein